MKYLRTYERNDIDRIDEIKSWMIEHDLDQVDLNLKISPNAVFNSITNEGDDFYLIYQWNGDMRKASFSEWSGNFSDYVLQFFKNMGPKEIKEQRLKNEMEKYNI